MCVNKMIAVYCDACVFRNYYEWRPGHKYIHYGEEAKKLFDMIEHGEYKLVVSDHLAFQLKAFSQFKQYVDKVRKKGNIIDVTVTQEDKRKAEACTTEYEDALHAELAIRAGADYLATSNVEHFSAFEGRIKVRRPELVGIF
jgi:predicted nucleic acid-binding protein